jgi:hypothetical protein
MIASIGKRWIGWTAVSIIVPVLVGWGSSPNDQAASQATCGEWAEISVPMTDGWSFLWSVAVSSPEDVWAVGDAVADHQEPLIEHWDGIRWTETPSPLLPPGSQLNGVAALSSDNAWAVGSRFTRNGRSFRALVEHWDGASWQVVSAPSSSKWDSMLSAVDVDGPTDAWAVGQYGIAAGERYLPRSHLRPLVIHWDGIRWAKVSFPHRPDHMWLSDISASSSDDIWAVGGRAHPPSRDVGRGKGIVAHWDSSRWKLVTLPPALGSSFFSGVISRSNEVWAVGTQGAPRFSLPFRRPYPDSPTGRPYALHRTDLEWSKVPTPAEDGGGLAQFVAPAAPTSGDTWAVGFDYPEGTSYEGGDPHVALIERSTGRWERRTESQPVDSRLLDIAGATDGTLWAVGEAELHALVERYQPC